jgi:tetratricopeptide (TPR) repeat protein
LENSKAQLKKDNPEIDFNIVYSKDFELIFGELNNDQLATLGFDIDSRNALRISRESLQKLEVDLDRGNVPFVVKTLENIKNIITEQNDEGLSLGFEIMECKALQKMEKIDEAIEKYKNIHTRYPKEARASLYLAEIYINDENYEENERLLNKAKAIDSSHWLYQLETLIRCFRLGKPVDISKIDEKNFPSDSKVKADYYRLYAYAFEASGDLKSAESFIEKAIKLNPDKFSNYEVKLFLIERKLLSAKNESEKYEIANQLLVEADKIYKRFNSLGDICARNRISLNIKKINAFVSQDNFFDFNKIAKETFELITQCYFDKPIDDVLTGLLNITELPQQDFNSVISYLSNSKKPISDNLAKVILLEFLRIGRPMADSKNFFAKVKKENIVELVDSVEKNNYEKLKPFLVKDKYFAAFLCVTKDINYDLRKKIFDDLPNDGSMQKDKILFQIYRDEKNIDEAFTLLKSFDLSKLSFMECKSILEVAQKKEAWDFVIIISEKILLRETNPGNVLQIKLQLFTANFNLGKYPEVIIIGKCILENKLSLINEKNREIIVSQVMHSYIQRSDYSGAKEFAEKYGKYIKKFAYKVFLEAEIYLKNKEPRIALKKVVDGIKSLKRPAPDEYGSLFLIFTQIDNSINLSLDSLEKVGINTFVKIKGEDKWLFIGDDEELDAIKIPEANRGSFLNRRVGEKITLASEYRSEKIEREIERVLSIEKYIYWQCVYNAHKLSSEGGWDKMEIIEVPKTDDGVDLKYILKKLENEHQRGKEFFDIYCKQNAPLALLAVSEGNLTNAIGRIISEKKGFIRFSTGAVEEFNGQKQIASKIIAGQEFYIDGTSAFVLSETGVLKTIQKYLPNLKVPQSVINSLLETKSKINCPPGQAGRIFYAQGKMGVSKLNQSQQESLEEKFAESIKIFESKPDNIIAISSANKLSVRSEQLVLPSLCDACILSQRDKLPILTEDLFYLQMNEIETKKTKPQYCSSFALMRVLYESGKISFKDYLDFYCYLASYRYRFLPVSADDLEKAVFGDGEIKIVEVENLRKFNIPLTFSEEYGVTFRNAAIVLLEFIVKMLMDDSVTKETMEKIFAEIVMSIPTSKDRKVLGRSFIAAAVQVINKSRRLILGNRTQEKIDNLSRFIEIYSHDGIIQSIS